MTIIQNRRDFLRTSVAGAAGALVGVPAAVQRALAIEAHSRTRSIKDVEHIVILMQENRSFDHYFGAMRGVRGFGDRHPIPLESGKPAWYQSDGEREITPFRLDGETMNAALINSTPHDTADSQAAWNQGKFGFWPKWKRPLSMGYYTRDEAPFQWALAEAFTICDGYHCSVATGTDPNRIMFWSGANFDPERRAAGINATDADAEFRNLRCWITGRLPSPGYTYRGSALTWPTIPDVLEQAGVSWRIYQDPNDNWTGAMHGGLAFESFRSAPPGSAIYQNGMTHWSLDDLTNDVKNGTVPQVSWVLPSQIQSEHPGGPCSPSRGGDFTQQVLEALTSNPDVWAKTVFFLTFDENDGLFDHVPPPAVPSYNADGTLAGKSTLELAGMYLYDNYYPEAAFSELSNAFVHYIDPADTISGPVRPWGLGPRVPMYVVSPWSRGGWVNSQVFDHTSVAQFIEKRFDVVVPAISPWHRAICGDLTSAFDFDRPNSRRFPRLPDVSNYAQIEAVSKTLPPAAPPATLQPLYQEGGMRWSRALPYELGVDATVGDDGRVELRFVNTGSQGAVFHVYDRRHLDRIPRRYTVEAGKAITDNAWDTRAGDEGWYDLWVCSTNGFVRAFKGRAADDTTAARPEVRITLHPRRSEIDAIVRNEGTDPLKVTIVANAYRLRDRDHRDSFFVGPHARTERRLSLEASAGWYDFTIRAGAFERRFAGRLESGLDSVSDPAMGMTVVRESEADDSALVAGAIVATTAE
jgi:phospholipase C